MLKEYRVACDKLGMKMGVYCSPWDRNNPQYGTPAYVQTYRAQLSELYRGYGTLFMSWHDGANGGDGLGTSCFHSMAASIQDAMAS